MILVASKADLEGERKVASKQGEGLAEKYNIKFIETSSKEDSNISRIFDLLTTGIMASMGTQEGKDTPAHLHPNKKPLKKEDCC